MTTVFHPSSPLLVTGSTGFIGRHFVRRLISDSIPIRLFVRSKSKAQALFPEVHDLVEGNLEELSQVMKATQGCDRVIHLGGLYRFGRSNALSLSKTNLLGTQNIIQAARSLDIQKLVYVGTAGVLKSSQRLITETDFPAVAPWGTPYKKSKWEAESLILQAIQEGLPACIASPTCPLGEEDETPTPTGKMILDFLQGRFPFYTHTGLNIIDIRDLSEGLLKVLDHGKIGSRSLLSAQNIWLKELLDYLSLLTDLPAPTVAIPSSLLLLGGALSEMVAPFIQHPPRLNFETALQSQRIQFYDAQKTYRELNWKPSFDCSAAILRSVEWYLKSRNINLPHRIKNPTPTFFQIPTSENQI